MNAPGWTYGEVDLEAVRAAREDGNVLLTRHWAEQSGRIGGVRTVALTR